MKPSKIIALASITSAFSIIFLIIGIYVEMLDLSCLFMASLCIMIPLSKDSLKSALLSYASTAILSLFFTMSTGRFVVTIIYAVFFGLHPIINYLQKKYNWNKILLFIIKALWFVGTCFMMYYLFKMFTDIPELIENIIVYVLSIGGIIVFFVYDILMFRFQYLTGMIINRLKL